MSDTPTLNAIVKWRTGGRTFYGCVVAVAGDAITVEHTDTGRTVTLSRSGHAVRELRR